MYHSFSARNLAFWWSHQIGSITRRKLWCIWVPSLRHNLRVHCPWRHTVSSGSSALLLKPAVYKWSLIGRRWNWICCSVLKSDWICSQFQFDTLLNCVFRRMQSLVLHLHSILSCLTSYLPPSLGNTYVGPLHYKSLDLSLFELDGLLKFEMTHHTLTRTKSTDTLELLL